MNQKVSPWVVVVVIAIVVAIAAFFLMKSGGPGKDAQSIEDAIKNTAVTSNSKMPAAKAPAAGTTAPAPTTGTN